MDLIRFAFEYDDEVDYGFDASRLCAILMPLIELEEMVGLESLKEQVVKQTIYLLQGYHSKNDFLHTVITGPPGVGKTTIAGILARIYSGLGFLPSSRLTVKRPADFIDKFIGGTIERTVDILEKALGGVLLIDEAYALGRSESDKEAYPGECINTLNQYLSEHRGDFVCIIAGYREELDEKFFSLNPGLPRRFPWRYNIESYSAEALYGMFEKQLAEGGWSINQEAKAYARDSFTRREISLDNFGGDTEVLFTACKICHSQRLFGCGTDRVFNIDDIRGGIVSFKDTRPAKKVRDPPPGLYI